MYLIDCRRCLPVGDLFYQKYPTIDNELTPVKMDDNGGVCLTNPDQSSTPCTEVDLRFNKVQVCTDMLPGCYTLTCQMRLRRRVRHLTFVDLP